MAALLPHISFDTGKNPQHSIIWLHGLGADGEDFAPIAQQIKLPVTVRYIFPHAPMRPVTINGGFVMRAWYDIVEPNISGRQDAEGIRASQSKVEALIAQEVARGVAQRNIFLAGFSHAGSAGAAAAVIAAANDGRARPAAGTARTIAVFDVLDHHGHASPVHGRKIPWLFPAKRIGLRGRRAKQGDSRTAEQRRVSNLPCHGTTP